MPWIPCEQSAKKLVEFALTHLDEPYLVLLALNVLNSLSIPAAPVFESSLQNKKLLERSINKLIDVCAYTGEVDCIAQFLRHESSAVQQHAAAAIQKCLDEIKRDPSRTRFYRRNLPLTETDQVAARLVLRQPLAEEDIPILIHFILGNSQNLRNFVAWRFHELYLTRSEIELF